MKTHKLTLRIKTYIYVFNLPNLPKLNRYRTFNLRTTERHNAMLSVDFDHFKLLNCILEYSN